MVLKKGSKGDDVKKLQSFLNLVQDGIFGSKTELSVKNWQSKNGLVSDGIVGPKTWDAMGLATTDISETYYFDSNEIEIQKHFLPKGEYKEGPTEKEYIFLHHTAGWNNPYNTIDSWGRDKRGSIATEFVMGGQKITDGNSKYDGEIIQAFPEGGYGWHLGENGSQHMHTHSVGIEVCNFGYLTSGGYKRRGKFIEKDSSRFYTYSGAIADPSQIVMLPKEFRGYKYWHKYSDTQIESLRLWIEWIGERDGIDIREGLPKWVKEKGADAFEFNSDAFYGKVKGILSHTNTRRDKFDMFPQQELLDMLVSL